MAGPGAGTGAGGSRSGRAGSLTSIAASAGVSVSTVSKVLNGRTDVAPETRERLGRILRQYGYQVAPRSGIGVVDLLIGGLGGVWSEELIRGAVPGAEGGRVIVRASVKTQRQANRKTIAPTKQAPAGKAPNPAKAGKK